MRGLGGACVAAPFLGSIAARPVNAQSLTPGKRLIAMFTHYGCVTTRFFPQKSHGPLTAADLQSTTLKHLAPYVDKLLLPRGIRAMNEWAPQLVRGQGGFPHEHIGSFLTCQPLSPNDDAPFSFEVHTLFPPLPVGPSLDYVMAQQVSPGGVPLLIQSISTASSDPQSAISYSAAQTTYRGSSPSGVFSKLTGLFEAGAPISPDSYQASRGKSVIDLVRNDLDTLERFDMSRSDRNKLEAWKAMLDQTSRVMGSLRCSAAASVALGLTQPNVAALNSSASNSDVLATKISGSLDGADLISNLAVLAALCNANPVIVLKYPPAYVFRALGLSQDSHSLSHRRPDATMSGDCVTGALEKLLTIDDFYARKFAHLIEQLNTFEEGDGKLLDNTAAVWFQEMSDGAAHNLNNLPIVQVGSAGGYFKTGWAVNVDGGSPNLTNGNSEAACTDSTSATINGTAGLTGTDPALANAPINKYYCNLMNALGVKAGADGFPALGGSAEVSRFGMYDKTEDFIHGGTNPPKINDPGEFSALRANA